MKLSSSRKAILFSFLLITFLTLPFLGFAQDNSQNIVTDLKVEDVPNDDGSGLMLSWKPLSKEKKIIEYRIYRGVTPDSMFYCGKIPVNAKTGVASDVMYFYDKDYNFFCDITSPGKLKLEKQQPKDSPLYRGIPRDVSVTGPMLKDYSILGVVPKKNNYYHTKRVVREKDGEENIFAGLKVHQLSMYKKLLADHEYYYTVLAVSQSGKYFPHAEPVSGAPRENSPEKTKEFYSVFVRDINRLQFEWSLPIFKDDIRTHSVFMMKDTEVEQFNTFVEQQKQIEANGILKKENPDAEIAEIEEPVANPAIRIFQRNSAYPYTSRDFAALEIVDGKVIDADGEIENEIDVENIDQYRFVFALADYSSGFETFSDVSSLDIITKKDLPIIPSFTIIDRENDKGDYNKIYWGQPVAFLTKVTFLNEEKTKIRINYDFVKNEAYKIKNIYFDIYDNNNNKLDTIDEFYQDRKFEVKIDEKVNILDGLTFKMRFNCKGDNLADNYEFSQDITYDEISMKMQPDELFFGEENINEYSYKIYKQHQGSATIRLAKKLAGIQRELDDNVRFERSTFVGVGDFDVEQDLYLFTNTISLGYDWERKVSVRASVFAQDQAKMIEPYQKQIDLYQAAVDTLEAGPQKDQLIAAIEEYTTRMDAIKDFPVLKEAEKFTNDKARMKFLSKPRENGFRTFRYFAVKSDGKAKFDYTEYILDENQNQYYFPVGNWFAKDKIAMLIATLIFGMLVFVMINMAKSGKELYIRPIAGIQEIDNAIGRATEMGRPILFVPGLSGISDVATLAGLSILGRVAKKAAEYDTRILVPVKDYIVLPIAQEIVKEAHFEAGRPDTYDKSSVFFITTSQFAFVAGVNGVMIREKTATNFYMGMFFAESLIMTETGNATGAIQISGTDAVTQIPFFITTCDYTLIGEELYAASAYLAREPLMLGTLKAQDYAKFLILFFVVLGTILSSSHLTFLINAFPEK